MEKVCEGNKRELYTVWLETDICAEGLGILKRKPQGGEVGQQ